ncbi:flagellar basal body rod protein FlgB [Methyloversatilis sp.]|uniref:flagellar basal body rod protein FlgB n=1 Tax=Methyloversatilis sp. TaxID=2569862 RepID=UPI0027370492|nr:flagellar basal body rod protein FlgB [Methyloversatilis sp.]MDP3577790.1 flagellar basal body rod protein FlgB [Methyloversatilis sp.]
MFDRLTSSLDFHGKALVARAERQRTIASNIANADTPGYVARDLNFQSAMSQALAGKDLAGSAQPATAAANPRHIPLSGGSGTLGSSLGYAAQTQPAMDNNSVDLDRERGKFVDNAVRYESTLRFINGSSRTILSAIQGQ